eukprot:CAMPEP_0174883028 /NCGR_PEP_ID=MMETSP1114-20130205/85060_1 /TAXON_ID=312471 /ORGANISM="Neobodo designis, Strain CCAP 1951/1" /LENGTH=363 /DNA_ID=CAMNT_0016118429 /DNA_START=202 /DNA_END=1290 /DNA_ORIENTATION=-
MSRRASANYAPDAGHQMPRPTPSASAATPPSHYPQHNPQQPYHGGNTVTPLPLSGTVYIHSAARPSSVYVVDVARVSHVPRGAISTYLQLCPNLEAPVTDSGTTDHVSSRRLTCPHGTACAFVHADTRGAPLRSPHTLEAALAGRYDRLPGGATIAMCLPVEVGGGGSAATPRPLARLPAGSPEFSLHAAPVEVGGGGSAATPRPLARLPAGSPEFSLHAAPREDNTSPVSAASGSPEDHTRRVAAVRSDAVLVTRATQRERGEADAYPLACPHFLTRGCCERGARCRFVHPLFMLSAPLLPAATQSLPAAAPQQHQHDQPRSASLSSPSSLGLHARTQHAPVTRGVSEAQPPPVASPLPTSN